MNLILQVQIMTGNQGWHKRTFLPDDILYKMSKQSAEQYAKTVGADYICLDNNKFLPTHPAPFQRFKMFELDYDYILYLDSDTIVHSNCPNLFEMNINGLAAVPDYDWTKEKNQPILNRMAKKLKLQNHLPFCSGVLLTDRQWRNEHKSVAFELLQDPSLYDQDILNKIQDNTPYHQLSSEFGAWYKNGKYITHYGSRARKVQFAKKYSNKNMNEYVD